MLSGFCVRVESVSVRGILVAEFFKFFYALDLCIFASWLADCGYFKLQNRNRKSFQSSMVRILVLG